MSRKARIRVLFLLCVVLVVAASACDGGDSSSLSDVCADRLETNEQIGSIFE